MKIMKSYRLNNLIIEELKKAIKEMNVTETQFIEMAVIEKLARINANKEK